jgi:hypothetical protein
VHAALLAAVERVLSERGHGSEPPLFCDRDSTDVLLRVAARQSVWDADGLIERADDGVEHAAHLVVFDLDTAHAER